MAIKMWDKKKSAKQAATMLLEVFLDRFENTWDECMDIEAEALTEVETVKIQQQVEKFVARIERDFSIDYTD